MSIRSRYGIAPYYRSRSKYIHHDDTGYKDEWQLEVYLAARERMIEEGLESVVDVGCGSGYKLIKHLGEFETAGVELAETVKYLKRTYPDRKWLAADLGESPPSDLRGDVVICADVIEHLVDPDRLITFLKALPFEYLFISTPDRRLAYRMFGKTWLRFMRPGYWGPPANPTHQREWTFREFGNYMRRHFDVIEHRITNTAQATQMVVCRNPETPQA